MSHPQQLLIDTLSVESEKQKRTAIMQSWLINADDDTKLRFKINWNIPHTLFNVMCKIVPSEHIQNIDWFQIYKQPEKIRFSK